MDYNKELKDRVKFKIAMSEIDDEERAKMKNIKNNVASKIGIVACFLLLVSGVTFADEISETVYDIYNFRKNYKIETKLPEDVVNDAEKLEEVKTNKNSIIKWDESAADIVETNNLKVDISKVYMDNYYMSFYPTIEFPEEVTQKMPLENIYLARFPDLVIKDENDNIIFCMEEKKLKELFKTDDLEAIKNNSKYCISEVAHYSFENYSELKKNPYKMEYNLNTKLPSIYPKSKKLTFEFTKVALDSPEASIGFDDKHYLHQDQTLTVKGNWKIEVDVPNECYERQEIIPYKLVEKNSNPNNQLLYCYYKDNLMHAEFNLQSEKINGPWGAIKIGDMLTQLEIEPIVKDYIIYKICNSDEYKEKEAEREKVYNIEDFYIENSKGEKSKPEGLVKKIGDNLVPASKTRREGGFITSNGILKASATPGFDENGNWGAPDGVIFDIEKEKLTNEMTIHIKYLEKDIEFKVEKMKGDN